jgi:hypothetical protein
MLSNMLGFYIVLFTSSIFLNSNWILSNIATILMSVAILLYYGYELNFVITQIATSIILIMVLVFFTTYYCEKKNKDQFI